MKNIKKSLKIIVVTALVLAGIFLMLPSGCDGEYTDYEKSYTSDIYDEKDVIRNADS